MRRGSILIVALWIIAVLSIMALSFATEAHLHSGINVYVRERNRVNRLTDAGQVLAEIILTGYADAKDWTRDENEKELMEDDRWYKEKRALKTDSKCHLGPLLIDEENPDSGTVEVEIEIANAGEENGININELYSGGDQNYRLRWEMIFESHGIPDDFEIDTKDGTFKLTDVLIASWNDWRDEDDTVTAIDRDECGAESKWYEETYEDEKTDEEDMRYPRNGSIPVIQELSYIRGFRDYPQVLTGGVLNPDAKKDEQIHVNGIMHLFCTTGSSKINVNSCTVEQLLTVPGIFQEDDDDRMEASRELATAIVTGLTEMPDGHDIDETRAWWPYEDWNDLVQRIKDVCDANIGNEASNYLVFKPDENTVFKVKITGESMGMTHSVNAKGYVKENKVRYIEWRED